MTEPCGTPLLISTYPLRGVWPVFPLWPPSPLPLWYCCATVLRLLLWRWPPSWSDCGPSDLLGGTTEAEAAQKKKDSSRVGFSDFLEPCSRNLMVLSSISGKVQECQYTQPGTSDFYRICLNLHMFKWIPFSRWTWITNFTCGDANWTVNTFFPFIWIYINSMTRWKWHIWLDCHRFVGQLLRSVSPGDHRPAVVNEEQLC